MTAEKWTADQKLEVVLAGLRSEGSTAELCRRYGISHSTFPTASCKDNKWRRLFIEGGRERLAKGPASSRERQLERGNEELMQALGELALELRVLKNYNPCKGRLSRTREDQRGEGNPGQPSV